MAAAASYLQGSQGDAAQGRNPIVQGWHLVLDLGHAAGERESVTDEQQRPPLDPEWAAAPKEHLAARGGHLAAEE